MKVQVKKSTRSEPMDIHLKNCLRIVKTLRIAVTGDVRITGVERQIIDHPDFQRLRGVRQLGSALLVYPTALHTRFEVVLLCWTVWRRS